MNKKVQRYFDHIVKNLDYPYIYNLKNIYGITTDEGIEYIMSKVLGVEVKLGGGFGYDLTSPDTEVIYYMETYNGIQWNHYKYDDRGRLIYHLNNHKILTTYGYDGNDLVTSHTIGNAVIIDNE